MRLPCAKSSLSFRISRSWRRPDLVQFVTDKYLRTKEDNTMPKIADPTPTDDEPEAQRAVIRLTLNEIAAEISTGLREASLDFPVYLTVSNSGKSLATMACPLDPSDTEWSRASAIVCKIIGKRLGGVRLRGRPLHCAVANSQMGATELAADARIEERAYGD
jgi:hypothetical protein